MALKLESNIHFQPMVPSTMGAAQGSRIKKRTMGRPGKLLSRARAKIFARTSTSSCEMKVKIKVLASDLWKIGSCTTAMKFLRPTKDALRLPVTALLMLKYRAKKNGIPTRRAIYPMAGAIIKGPSNLSRSSK